MEKEQHSTLLLAVSLVGGERQRAAAVARSEAIYFVK
jgi:hypothetical protein